MTEYIWLLISEETNPEWHNYFSDFEVLSTAYVPLKRMRSFILRINDWSEGKYQTFRSETKWIRLLELAVPGTIEYPQWAATSKDQVNYILTHYGHGHLHTTDLSKFYLQ